MTGNLIDSNLREAAFLLNLATTAFFEKDGSTLAPGEKLIAAAAPQEFVKQFVEWLIAMFEARTIDRHDLEEIFSYAEHATDSETILKAISGIWDDAAADLPVPGEPDYLGSAAESTGDYSRLYFPKPWSVH